MLIDLLGPSRNGIKSVFTYLSDRSLMRMREISKLMRETVDSSMLCARDTTVTSLCIGKPMRRGVIVRPIVEAVQIRFCFEDLRNFELWKIYCRHLCAKFEITEDGEFDQYNIMIRKYYMNSAKAVIFIECLKSVVKRTRFDLVSVMCKRAKIMQACSSTFTGKNISKIGFTYNNGEDLMDLLKCVKTTSISCPCSVLTKDVREFLLNMAETMDAIYVYPRKSNVDIKINLLVQKMLRLKCSNLWFNGKTNPFPTEDVEKLLQFFHRIDKRVSFSAPSTARQTYFHSGAYRVKINRYLPNAQLLLIDHFEDL